ncbi:MAG TPA: tRNA (adenosine(37)-N6)-threonylcarbamoyltransferase complex dimerization subunit type 1 TsaB [Chthoniobacteraceae bacterium]|jgi:tRNA threonylcarbamoyladenosine biosynthesis protein TsaB|nr:tRNA (adenosine(37)-N6)-threonylcarbamoyltransferase complex dimerization subunit type 1 TsaB [Chthoniobacteraceae bacterium]
MTILGIDTSTARGSVALLVDGECRLEETFTADRSHSASLFTVLERARAAAEQIDVIAIGLGPGSYAGVRIAIAAAIGFELALGSRLLGLASVAALETAEPHYVVIGDARRETFYFTRVEEGICVEGPLLLTAEALRERLGSISECPVLTTAALPLFPQALVALPLARRLVQLAQQDRGILARGDLEPLYLREPHITQPKSTRGK